MICNVVTTTDASVTMVFTMIRISSFRMTRSVECSD